MGNTEIISIIKDKIPSFSPLAIIQDHPDEITMRVELRLFKDICFALHQILSSAVMMLFALDERKKSSKFEINCVFLDIKRSQWVIVNADIPQGEPYFESLAKNIYSASLFEREIKEMFGIEPKGNPDLRRLNLHDEVCPQGNFPLRKDFNVIQPGNLSEYKFGRVEGEGIFEVPVGPVHAGIIGPGHFRFSVAGEPIINLETRLGFTHRGVEKLFEAGSLSKAVKLSECVSGDSCFAHSLSFSCAAEKILGLSISKQSAYLRAVFLELERMHNHVNDIGGIAVDVGFSFPAALASIIKESILQLNEELTGSRYLKNVNTVGGVSVQINNEKKALLRGSLKKITRDFRELVGILNSSVSFMDRVDTCGALRRKTAEDLGVTGLTGRASGIPIDLRKHFPGIYQEVRFKIITQEAGDVLSRLLQRIGEFEESVRMVSELIEKTEVTRETFPAFNPKAGQALGYAEGWRGPVLYWVKLDAMGAIKRCKIVDPSFHNWQGLSFAVLGNIIPDFPVCNKSFDLSYSGNDL